MKKKIIISLFIIFVIIITGSILIYHQATKNQQTQESIAVERAKEYVNISEVKKVTSFHYMDSYYIIEAVNENSEDIIIWIPEEKNKEVLIKNAKDGISKEEAMDLLVNGLDNFSNNQRPKNIINIKLGMVDDVPVYEITYRDQKDRYSFIYIDFYNGDWYRVYNF
ncbi:DUF5590 domain-containing protein [Bacillus kwashiorkori]|uniref:cell wall elongation regulator TseB-like domain-containing protein n=1 Tax=Bacillus kwashiorkori TaxID=1522318 RepID=UPI000783D429|nr:DUF5590 domain-containing protein [Bacillus kwashiorkori]